MWYLHITTSHSQRVELRQLGPYRWAYPALIVWELMKVRCDGMIACTLLPRMLLSSPYVLSVSCPRMGLTTSNLYCDGQVNMSMCRTDLQFKSPPAKYIDLTSELSCGAIINPLQSYSDQRGELDHGATNYLTPENQSAGI
jgi:hypothetical protein